MSPLRRPAAPIEPPQSKTQENHHEKPPPRRNHPPQWCISCVLGDTGRRRQLFGLERDAASGHEQTGVHGHSARAHLEVQVASG
ncbi:MAG: hypothetical protein QOI70_631 [Microbacteriaceae bacterium]|nr:hypothetical protein [Microbacteriaceae bacterium]